MTRKGLTSAAPPHGQAFTSAEPERIEWTENVRRAIDLRKAGATYAQIAVAVKKDDGTQVWNSEGAAANAIKRALKAALQEPADELRMMMLERQNHMIRALWPQLQMGPSAVRLAVDRILLIEARQAALLGLDAPSRVRVEYIDDETLEQALARWEAESEGAAAPAGES